MSDANQGPSTQSSDASPRSSSGRDAVFMGWQGRNEGDPFALYNITAEGHPYFGSTVSEKSLRKLNLEIPKTPPPHAPVRNR